MIFPEIALVNILSKNMCFQLNDHISKLIWFPSYVSEFAIWKMTYQKNGHTFPEQFSIVPILSFFHKWFEFDFQISVLQQAYEQHQELLAAVLASWAWFFQSGNPYISWRYRKSEDDWLPFSFSVLEYDRRVVSQPQHILEGFQFRWLKTYEMSTAFPITVMLISNRFKWNPP